MSDTSGRTPEGAKGWFDHQLDIAESAFQKLPQYMQDAARNRKGEVGVDVEQAGTPSVENGMICGECGSAKSPKHCCHVCDGRAQDAMGRVLPSVADWFGPQPMPEGWPAAIDPKDARIAELAAERDAARQQRDDAESRERSWISECLMYRRAQETNQTAVDKVRAERDTLLETTGQQAEKIKAMSLAIHGVTEWLDHPHEPKHSAEWRAGWDCLLNLHLREVIEGFKDDAQAAYEEWSGTYSEVLDAQDESKRLAAELAERDETIAALISTFQERYRAMHRRAQKAESKLQNPNSEQNRHGQLRRLQQSHDWYKSHYEGYALLFNENERLRAELARKGGE